jgi:hypothetical protein
MNGGAACGVDILTDETFAMSGTFGKIGARHEYSGLCERLALDAAVGMMSLRIPTMTHPELNDICAPLMDVNITDLSYDKIYDIASLLTCDNQGDFSHHACS